MVGRNTQGVRLIRTGDDEQVVGLQRIDEVDEDDLEDVVVEGEASEATSEQQRLINLRQTMSKIFNFSAGPAMLPAEVMLQAQEEFLQWNGTGVSVMEFSHRDPAYVKMAQEAEQDLRELLSVPDDYHVLFLQGGGRGQFSAVPQNIAAKTDTVDYLDCGTWSGYAIREAEKYVSQVNVVGAAEQTEQGKRIQPAVNGN